MLSLSVRQVKRLRARYRVEAARSLRTVIGEGNLLMLWARICGSKIVDLMQGKYTGFNQQHLH